MPAPRRFDPRHRRGWDRPSGVRAGFGVVLAIGAGTVLAGGATGSTFALWNDRGAVNAATITSGSLSVSVSSTFNTTLWSNMVSGESIRQPFTVTNTGNIPTRVRVSVSVSSPGYEIRVANGACGVSALTGATATTVPTELYPVTPLAAGASGTQCLEVRLTTSAVEASTATFAATVTAHQVQP